jgi:hypothetical protein
VFGVGFVVVVGVVGFVKDGQDVVVPESSKVLNLALKSGGGDGGPEHAMHELDRNGFTGQEVASAIHRGHRPAPNLLLEHITSGKLFRRVHSTSAGRNPSAARVARTLRLCQTVQSTRG